VSESPLSCIVDQSARTWVHGLRYYGTHPKEAGHVGLGYGTRLSGYATLDPSKGRARFPEASTQEAGPFPPMKQRSWDRNAI
jgi:hypothetical protein